MSNQSETLLKNPEVLAITRLSRSTIGAKVRAGTFPKPVKIGKRATAWRSSDIDRWIADLTPATEVSE